MKLKLDISHKSLNKNQEELCGDYVEIWKTENSTILVLADGMGSGVKANILSTLTTKILGTMLYNGFSLDESVETIAKTLPICQIRQMAYSTFTILQIYDSGETYIVDFDSPGCLFMRDGKLLELPFYERELTGKVVKECRIYAQANDMFILMSDGVTHAGVGRLCDFGWGIEAVGEFIEEHFSEKSLPSRVTSGLLEHCNEIYEYRPGDDTTVAAVRVINKKTLKILTGPPLKPENDEKVVREFMQMEGEAVLCGGTTASIVSRVLGRPLEVSLEYFEADVPPIATMEGMALVTEGIVTLNCVLQLLNQYNHGADDAEFYQDLDKQDGAARLARMIIENCTDVYMIVGKTINQAYQNPMVPFEFNLRVALIEKLKDAIEQAGKTVIIQYV
ncbi:MAG: SpoIIE family protein phosphatase [Peptococcaceae bacterium]|nr:SpoIIE family protein phosphatase [Peptococcaceae bacterium]